MVFRKNADYIGDNIGDIMAENGKVTTLLCGGINQKVFCETAPIYLWYY